MNRKIRLYAAVALVALFVAGCSGPCSSLKSINAPSTRGGSADFTTYVALGTSISAGGQSGGIVETHQAHAFPALFAHQAGARAFTYDRVSPDGIPALLRLVSLNPLTINNDGRTTGAPRDLAQATPYHNLGVYGSLLYDCDSTTFYTISPYATFFGLVARGRGSLLQQAAELNPTFVSFEYGANEVLGAALAGSGTPLVSTGAFSAILSYTLGDLFTLMPDAKLAIFNVPDVTSIPFLTTVKPYAVVNGVHIPYVCSEDAAHPDGRLNEDDYLLLTALASLQTGTGVPVALGGNGLPLPDSQVLTAGEAASLQAAVDGYNATIFLEATARGAALVDLNGVFRELAVNGYDFRGVHYSTAFVTGGLFSLDGVHPTDLGQGLIANAMIDAVNARFSSSVPHVDLGQVATATSSRARPAQTEAGATLPRIEGLDEMLKVFTARR